MTIKPKIGEVYILRNGSRAKAVRHVPITTTVRDLDMRNPRTETYIYTVGQFEGVGPGSVGWTVDGSAGGVGEHEHDIVRRAPPNKRKRPGKNSRRRLSK